MSNTIRMIKPEDVSQIIALQLAYRRVHPDADFIPGEMYISPTYEHGANVYCALKEQQELLGYAAISPNFALETGIPHTVWCHIRIWPDVAEGNDLWIALFQHAADRAEEIGRSVPGDETRLTFQFYSSETEGISFAESMGCSYIKSGFRMTCDLSGQLVVPSIPQDIDVRVSRLETTAEQQSYVDARNEALPDLPITLADWQNFIISPLFKQGTTVTAFVKGLVIGSVTVYWDETEIHTRAKAVGFTEFIFVKEGWRQRGIASHLVARGLFYLREHGLREAQLDVDTANRDALNMYRRLGYIVTGESRIYALTL